MGCDFMCLFQNNLIVLALVLVFSFVFGAGAIYIITWNATIVGVLIGTIARSGGGNVIVNYLIALPMSLLSLLPHGIFEIGAYFFGGLAGGMLSAALVRGKLPKKSVIKDVFTIFLIAVVLVAIGALVESMI